MREITGAEVLAERERLLKTLPFDEEPRGIITTDRAAGKLYLLSRYEDMIWWLPRSGSPKNAPEKRFKLDFSLVEGERLRAEAKLIIAGLLLQGERGLSTATTGITFSYFLMWFKWLTQQGIDSHQHVTPMLAGQYVQYVNQSISQKNKGKPLSASTKVKKFNAVELCWRHLRQTQSSFDHPWPESTAHVLANVKLSNKPKTEIIPDQVLSVVFQLADSQLGRADELLQQRDALSEYQPSVKCPAHQTRKKSSFLKVRGWSRGLQAFNAELTKLRDSCFVIILATTGIRAHELGNIRRNQWYSEIRNGERFYFLGSRSDKTYEGETSWLCPEIAIKAVKVLERLSEPLQHQLEIDLKKAREAGDFREMTRLTEIFGCVGLTYIKRERNIVGVVSNLSLGQALRNFARDLKLDWPLASHQFRRTFAHYVVHHKLGDLRYLRDHFKHWSLDMTALYALNEAQDLELYDQIYAAFDQKRQAIIGHWLEPDTPLSGSMASHIRQMRSRSEGVRTYKDRKEMIEAISELVFLRSTGIAWCTNDTGVDCAGGQCEDCEHGCIDDSHKPFWEGLYLQQIELRQIDDLDDSGSKTVERTMARCERVLTDLGVDINSLKEQVADVEAI